MLPGIIVRTIPSLQHSNTPRLFTLNFESPLNSSFMKALLVISTFPDADTARQIGTALVQKQLAACVNITPGIESIFNWKGKLDYEPEILALIKTTSEAYPALEAELLERHPYDNPELIAIDVARGSSACLDWIAESTRSRS